MDLQKVPENSREEGTSCFQLLSLVRAAAPRPRPTAGRQGSLGHCLLMETVPFLSPSSAKNLTSPTEEKEPFLPAANRGSTDAFLGFGESPSCLPGSLWCRSHEGLAWRRGGGRPAVISGPSLGFLLLHGVALRLPWWAHTFPLAPSRNAPPPCSGEADTSLLKTLFSLSSQTPTVVHLPASPWTLTEVQRRGGR